MSSSDAAPIGEHALLDIAGARRLDDPAFLDRVMHEAAAAAGARVIGAYMHHFGRGEGVTGVLMLAESHISVHTWPERDFAAFDVFMCGDASTARAVECIERAFPEGRARRQVVARGTGHSAGR
jgi:S-adenosylmethionine decarboxylase